MVNLFLNSKIVGEFKHVDSLYNLYLAPNNEYSCMHIENIVSKRFFIKEKFSLLWHKGLGHISNEILPSLDFVDLDICVDCIRGKLTKTKKKEATHSFDLLEIVHTDISGILYLPYLVTSILSHLLMTSPVVIIFT